MVSTWLRVWRSDRPSETCAVMCRKEINVPAGSGGCSPGAAGYAGEEAEVRGEENDDAVGLSKVVGADDDAFGVEVSSSS